MVANTRIPTNPTFCPTPTDWAACKPWDLTLQDRTNSYFDALSQESLAIAGAQVNVYKLLGVHEQQLLVDAARGGSVISGGDWYGYPASNSNNVTIDAWRSGQKSRSSILASSYIGYDFGVKKLPSGRVQYGVVANITKAISTMRIKQGDVAAARAARVRVERSDDGVVWKGVAVVQLPDNNNLNTISFKETAPSRFWRIRPVEFNGTSPDDTWSVVALEWIDQSATSVSNIQDKIFLENRNRDYSTVPTLTKGFYDIQHTAMELMKYGTDMPSMIYTIRVNFTACVGLLGRPLIVGDILELPSEIQYNASLRGVQRWIEVSDVSWDMGSFTPGWYPTLLRITAIPAISSEETQTLFGDMAIPRFDIDNAAVIQDYSDISDTIAKTAADQVPERGAEGSNVIREFTPEDIAATTYSVPRLANLGFNRSGLYVEDAIPQNGAVYTEGELFPLNPKNGEYHRMTYAGLASTVPARLYRFSSVKNRWVYLETDRRAEFNNQKRTLDEYLQSPNAVPNNKI